MTDCTTDEPGSYLGIGAVATEVGVPRSTIRDWERLGLIPASERLQPGARRIWRLADLPQILKCVESRRARREERRLSAA
jgi:DNA-binding transcriptional MerR regulator